MRTRRGRTSRASAATVRLPIAAGQTRQELLALWEALETFFQRQWQRSLPLQDAVVDRWERARRLGFGEGSSIYASSFVFGNVHVGRQTWVGPYTVLDGSGGLRIGSFCSIAAGTQIYSHDTVRWALSKGKARSETAPTVVGDGCYLGSLTVVDRGVRIGDRCVIGAHSFVHRDLPAGAIAVGAPCRIVGRVEGRGARVRLVYFSDDDER